MTRFVEFCAGIGGFSLAATWTGWDVVGHVEIDPFCTRVLKHHWPDALHLNDLRSVHGDEWGPVDVVAGGIPCQPFSSAGIRSGTHDPRHLWPQFFRVVEILRPRVIVVENVDDFIDLAIDICWADMESIGYACGAIVLPACGLGAQHRRDRVWFVAHTNSNGKSTHPLDGAPGSRKLRPHAIRRGNPFGHQPRLVGENDGLPRWVARYTDPRWDGNPMNAFGRDWEEGVPRVTAGCENRIAKLKALGNSLVPQVAYQLFQAIDETLL